MSQHLIESEIPLQDKFFRGEAPLSVYPAKNYGRGAWQVCVVYPGSYEVGLSPDMAEDAAELFEGRGVAHVAHRLASAARDVRELNSQESV